MNFPWWSLQSFSSRSLSLSRTMGLSPQWESPVGLPTMGPYLSKTYTIHMNTRTHRQADKNKGWNNFIFEDSLNMNYCFIIYSFFCLCTFNAGINTNVLRCFKAILKVLKLCNVYHFMKFLPIYIYGIFTYVCTMSFFSTESLFESRCPSLKSIKLLFLVKNKYSFISWSLSTYIDVNIHSQIICHSFGVFKIATVTSD